MAALGTEERRRNGVSLLSLDAGGPRGISQLEILKHIMDKLTHEAGCNSTQSIKRPCDVFAMIGGTGTGGLVAILLVVLEMTADEALETFTGLVTKLSKDGDIDPSERTEALKQAIDDILGKQQMPVDTKLVPPGGRPPACKLFLPVLDQKNTGSPIILTNYFDRHGPPTNLTVAEAMLATCASPPLFSPVKVVKDFSTIEYIAADLGLSNPTHEIIDVAHRAFGGEVPVICLLSIGCGNTGVNAAPIDSNAASHVTFLKRIAMDSERTAQMIASQMGRLTLYHRVSVAYGMERTEDQLLATPEDIAAQTRAYLNDEGVARTINQCTTTLRDGAGFTTLEQLKYSGGGDILAPELLELTPNYVERKIPTEFLEKRILDDDGSIKPGSKRIILTGMGGCGKTQIVRKFIEDHGDRFTTVFFVDGSSEESLKNDIIQHVRSLGGAESQKLFKESMQFLSLPTRDSERLLVIDNVDNPNINISTFLPRWKRGTTIITSRNSSHGQLNPSAHLQLDVMSVEESMELLIKGSGSLQLSDSHQEAAANVAEELGYLPIALVQAASYIYRTGCSATTYISLLRTSRERVLSDPATSQIDMRYTTAFAAFDASYSILPFKVQQALHLLSFFHHQKFPVECIGFDANNEFSFEHHYSYGGEEYKRGKECLKRIFYSNGKWDPAEVESIVSSLRNHSLVTVIPTEITRLLQMHSLVHEWARLRVPSDDVEQLQDAAIRLLCCNAQESNYSLMQYLQVHVHALSTLWETVHVNDMAGFSFILDQFGAYTECLKLMRCLYARLTCILGPDDISTIRATAHLASSYRQLGRYGEAEVLEVKVLKQRIRLLGVDHPSTILASANLAVTYGRLGRYGEAEVLELEVLQQNKRFLGVDHLNTIISATNLAQTYNELGRYDEAEVLQVEVLDKSTKLLGVDHPDTIRASAHLAATYHQLGRHREAQVLQVEVLKQRTKLLGAKHPSTIIASAFLAQTYSELGQYGEAELLQVEVLKQYTKSLGADHPHTIIASSNLALTYSQLGQYTRAAVLQAKVLEQRMESLGMNHPSTLQAATSLASTYGQLDRYNEAEMLQVCVLGASINLLGEFHPSTIQAAANLASTYSQSGQYAQAEALEVQVLEQRTNLLGLDHPTTIRASATLAATYSQLGRHAEAENIQSDVLRRRMTIFGDRHPDTLIAMWSLASTYKRIQRDSEALELAKKAHSGCVEILGEGHPHSLMVAAFLASFTTEQSVDSS